jgi:hypothetical protein
MKVDHTQSFFDGNGVAGRLPVTAGWQPALPGKTPESLPRLQKAISSRAIMRHEI